MKHETSIANPIQRLNNIIKNQIYIVCGTIQAWARTMNNLTNYIDGIYAEYYRDNLDFETSNTLLPNIYLYENIKYDLKNGHINETAEKIRKYFNSTRGGVDAVKFDIVIGNPPYSYKKSDIYIDFTTLGYMLSRQYTVMITPAKWQAKGGDDYNIFRNTIVPHMSKIVFYPCAQEIFDIRNLDGISYFLIDKDVHEEKEIVNKSSRQPIFNNSCTRPMSKQLNNVSLSIMSKIAEVKHINISSVDIRHFGLGSKDYGSDTGELNVMQGDKCTGHYTLSDVTKNQKDIDKFKVVMLHMCGNSYWDNNGNTLGLNKMYINKPNEIQVYDYMPIWISKSMNECKNFILYFNTRIIRFILMMSIVGQTANNKEYWRFVPDPGSFDRIFEDKPLPGYTPDENGEYIDSQGNKHCSLYVKYNLTPEEINIIESVIKAR